MELRGICLGVNTMKQQPGDTRLPLIIVDLEGLPVMTSDSDEVNGLQKGDNVWLDVNVRTNQKGGRSFWLNHVVDTG